MYYHGSLAPRRTKIHDFYHQFAGDSCTSGFLSNVTPCSGGCYTGDSVLTNRLYPEVKFTCNGMVTEWRAAARQLDGSRNTILWIWRETSSGSQMYRRISSVELGVCGSGVDASPVAGMEGVYECTLPESSRVTVQPGDIIGTEVAASSEVGFGLLYDNSRGYGPRGYIFDGQVVTTAMLGPNNNRPNEIPLISLTVEPIMATATTTSEPRPQTQTEGATTESRDTTEIYTNSDTTTIDTTPPQTTTQPNGSFVEDSFPKELIIGALVAGLVMVGLLIVIAFILAYLSRKVGARDGNKERTAGGRSRRKSSNLKKDLQDMEYNAAYIPRIPVKDNVAYYGPSVDPYTVVYDTILDAEEPSSMNTMTREVSVSNMYSSVA